jgi:SAM-dependent methyltransferase
LGAGWYAARVDERDREAARHVRLLLERGACDGAALRAALERVPPLDRDAWTDLALGLGPLPDDGPELPRGCVPYLPCSPSVLLRALDAAAVEPSDVFVDVGSGEGRTAALVSLLAGATVVGIEVQPALVAAARELASRLRLARVSFVEADAADLPAAARAGSVFFLNCPFSGDRLARLLARLEPVARARALRLCFVDLPLPPCPWLEPVTPPASDLATYRSRPPG